MKRVVFALAAAAARVALAHGAQVWEWALRPAEVKSAIYVGDLGDTYAPTPSDARVAFYVRARAAKQMFDAMGPDVGTECDIAQVRTDFGCERAISAYGSISHRRHIFLRTFGSYVIFGDFCLGEIVLHSCRK